MGETRGVELGVRAGTNKTASFKIDPILQLISTMEHAFKAAQRHLSLIKIGQSLTIHCNILIY